MNYKKRTLICVSLLLAFAIIFTVLPKNLVKAQTETPYTGMKWMISQMDGSHQPYGVFIPNPSDKDTPRPVLFIGHGAGGRTSVPGATAQPQKWITDNNKNWIVVRLDFRGPQANNQGQFDPFDVVRDLEEVQGYTLDRDRFYIQGGSLGGSDAYRLAFRYPDFWAAFAPQTGWTDYHSFWPQFYEHWDKAEVLRRSMFEGYQTTNLNIRNNAHNLTYFVDPSLKPLLETQSSLYQAENGMHVPGFIMSCYDDPTNPRMNQEQVRDVYVEHDYDHVFKQLAGGHGCAVLDWAELMPWFDSQVRVTNPLVATYTTNTLQYNSAYWIQLDKFVVEKEWAKLTASIDEETQQTINVETQNLAQFTLNLNDILIDDFNAEIEVTIDGEFVINAFPSDALTFEAQFDENFALIGWEVKDDQVHNSLRGLDIAHDTPLLSVLSSISREEIVEEIEKEKVHGISGPFSDGVFKPFVPVYGTQGTEAQNADSLRAAQEFAMEWNNWLILHIGNYGGYAASVPGANVWEGIPTFPYYNVNKPANPPGGLTTEQVNTLIIRPVADVDLTFGDVFEKNLFLFGEPSSNGVIAYIEADLPFEFGVGSITVDGRTYADGAGNNPKDAERIDYSFIYPNPLNGEKYITVSRYGLWMDWKNPATAWIQFTSTGIEFQSFAFQFPDYFIGWRLNGLLMGGINGMYFQDVWFESGYFNGDWELDNIAPITTAEISGTLEKDWYVGDVEVELTANDNLSGFGVDRTEYSLDGGLTWAAYSGDPILFTEPGVYSLLYRSVDKSGKFEYGMFDPWEQFGKTFQDGEQWLSFPSWGNVEDANELIFTIAFKNYMPIINLSK